MHSLFIFQSVTTFVTDLTVQTHVLVTRPTQTGAILKLENVSVSRDGEEVIAMKVSRKGFLENYNFTKSINQSINQSVASPLHRRAQGTRDCKSRRTDVS